MYRLQTFLILCAALIGDGLEALAHCGEAVDHLAEISVGDAHEFDMIERGAGGGAQASAEQADFAEIIAAGEIGENEFAAWITFGNFHEADADKVEAVGGITLPANDLAGGEALQLDAFLEVGDEVGCEIGEHRDTAKLIFQRAAAIVLIDL